MTRRRTPSTSKNKTSDNGISILGMSCRFPGANSAEAYWDLLCEGEDSVTSVPAHRWDIYQHFGDRAQADKITSNQGGFIEDIEYFDNGFFSISDREAHSLDPQQRLLLELAWESLERSALLPSALRNSTTGVFIGATTQDYGYLLLKHTMPMDQYFLSGNTLNSLAGRISYSLGLSGPSYTIDSACSSSLCALHLACQSLRSGEIDYALVGGSNLILTPEASVATSTLQMLASDGRCKTFSERADGYIRSEGCSMVVLQRTRDAQKKPGPILANIIASASNHNGASAGLTVPSKHAQIRLIKQALAQAKLDPLDVGFIETHGTGTKLGDPIEADAIFRSYCINRDTKRALMLGAVKSNIGHTEACAGLAGLIKTVLCLQHASVPANLHCDDLNSEIAWNEHAVVVPRRNIAWRESRRIAGINAFGASGTNVHVLLEHAQESRPQHSSISRGNGVDNYSLIISAKSMLALRNLVIRYREYLLSSTNHIEDICYSAACFREIHRHTIEFNGADAPALIIRMDVFLSGAPGFPLVSEQQVRAKWEGLLGSRKLQARCVALPTYAFERRRFWLPKTLTPPEGALIKPSWEIGDIPASAGKPDHCVLARPLASLMSEFQSITDSASAQDMEAYLQGIKRLERRTAQSIRQQFKTMGMQLSTCAAKSLQTLLTECHILPGQTAYFECLLNILVQHQILRKVADGWCAAEAWAIDTVDKTSLEDKHLLRVEYELLQRCEQNIAAVLSGLCDPVHLLFPTGDTSMLAHLYCDSYAASFMNDLMAAMVAHIQAHFPVDRPLRILEIGAGTGGSTSKILKAIDTSTVQYCFSDISPQFLQAAKKRFGDDGNVSYAILDLDNCEQAEAHLQAYDLILATNVVHATRDIHASLNTIKTLLAAGGSVILQEGIVALNFIDVIFGMTKGWWCFSDKGLRPEHPLLTRKQWLKALDDCGFSAQALSENSHSITRYQSLFSASLCSSKESSEEIFYTIVGENNADNRRLAECIGKEQGSARVSESLDVNSPGVGMGIIVWCLALCDEAYKVIPERIDTLLTALSLGERIWFITRECQSVCPADAPINAEQSLLWGIAKTLMLESPEILAGIVDSDGSEKSLALLKSIVQGDIDTAGEKFIALRQGQYRVQRITPIPAVSRAENAQVKEAAAPLSARFTSAAAYLVTGGFGGVGLSVALWLAERGAGMVVLVGRSGADQLTGARARLVKSSLDRIRRSGAQVVTVTADVSHRDELQSALDKVHLPLKGVFHCAGVLSNAVLSQQTAAQFEQVLAAKVAGTHNLHLCTAGEALDYFVLFSSTASLLGSPGQGNHAAANAFLDSFAAQRRAQGLPATSIQWGPWSHVGAAVGSSVEQHLHSKGIRYLDPFIALQLLDQALCGDEAVVAALSADYHHLASYIKSPLLNTITQCELGNIAAVATPSEITPAIALAPEQNTARGNMLQQRLSEAPARARLPMVKAYLQEALSNILGHGASASVNTIDMDLGFFELGLDSLTSLELRKRISDHTQIDLKPTIFFDFATPSSLATYLLAQLLTPVSQASSGATFMDSTVKLDGQATPASAGLDQKLELINER